MVSPNWDYKIDALENPILLLYFYSWSVRDVANSLTFQSVYANVCVIST